MSWNGVNRYEFVIDQYFMEWRVVFAMPFLFINSLFKKQSGSLSKYNRPSLTQWINVCMTHLNVTYNYTSTNPWVMIVEVSLHCTKTQRVGVDLR